MPYSVWDPTGTIIVTTPHMPTSSSRLVRKASGFRVSMAMGECSTLDLMWEREKPCASFQLPWSLSSANKNGQGFYSPQNFVDPNCHSVGLHCTKTLWELSQGRQVQKSTIPATKMFRQEPFFRDLASQGDIPTSKH